MIFTGIYRIIIVRIFAHNENPPFRAVGECKMRDNLKIFGLLCAFGLMVFGGLWLWLSTPSYISYRLGEMAALCRSNLLVIGNAKELWAAEHDRGLRTKDPLTRTDIRPYFDNQQMWPKCPSGGVYTIGKVSEPPTCTIKGHKLGRSP